MKGPGLRLNLAVERRWTCPACGRKAVSDGDVTTLACSCTEPPQWMKMEDPQTNLRPQPKMPEAQTLTDEDLDRLGIEPLKDEPPTNNNGDLSHPSPPEPSSDETAAAKSTEPPPSDEFGAGIVE